MADATNMVQVAAWEYFLGTLEYHRMTRKDTQNSTEWWIGGTCMAQMVFDSNHTSFWLHKSVYDTLNS